VTNQGSIRVYLVDDHEVVRRGVASVLESDPRIQVVGQTDRADVAVREVLAQRPDVVILDDELRDGSGIDVCRKVRAADPGIKALILTAHEDPELISAAILAGASGYVLKRIEGDSLVSGVRLIAGGHSLIDPSVAQRVIEQMEGQKRSLDLVADLTPQQRKILLLLADGLTNREISQRLFLAEKTVKNHVTGLLARLGVQHRTQAAVLAARLRSGGGGEPRR
jgi:DNA-binding NarL/FixJ family response regulator